MKICVACKVKLPLENFYKRKDRPIGVISECKKCTIIRNRKTNRQRKIDVLNAYGGTFCKCCNETEVSFLSIDHIENDGAIERKRLFGDSRLGSSHFYNWLKKNNFPTPERYQVLCINCQWGKRYSGTCPHQLNYAKNINNYA